MSLAHSWLAPSLASTALLQVRSDPSRVVNHEVAKPAGVLETGFFHFAHFDMLAFLRAVLLCEMRATLIIRKLK